MSNNLCTTENYTLVGIDEKNCKIPQVATFEKVSYEQFKRDFYNIYGEDSVEETSIEDIYEQIELPKRSTKGSAGYDFISPLAFQSQKNDILIPTGIRCQIQEGWALWIVPRSGLGFKYAVRLANTVGIIDSDYYNSSNEGHIMVKLTPHIFHNAIKIERGDRVCQGIFVPFGLATNDFYQNEKRDGGMGSTGK